MMALSGLDLRQRYNLVILATLAIAGCLLILSLYLAIKDYANDYTRHYWQEHAGILANSVEYSVTLGAKDKSAAIANSFAADKNVLEVAVYTNLGDLLAASGKAVGCNTRPKGFTEPFFSDAPNYWCFYSPIYQDSPAGEFEQKLARSKLPAYLGHIELVVSKAGLTTLLHQILAVSGLVIMGFLLVIFMVLRRFSGSFTQPMVEIVRVLRNVAQGVQGGRVSFSGAPDIVSMGDTFNDMLSLIEMNEKALEQKIADRTSELKVALESSEAANEYKTQIVATVSHEMIAPLHTIKNCLTTSLDALPDSPYNSVLREFHQRALVRSDELNDLINNILMHGKLETNSVKSTLLPLALKPLMQACADKITPHLNRNRNTLRLLGHDGTVLSDRMMLSHIINNLLGNACKFTVDGEITLTWRQESSCLMIEVSDTGCGIPEPYLDKIFDSFWQVDMSMTRKYGGTGIGLTVAKQFVDQLCGLISVSSQVEKGSVFTVRIPNQLQ